MFGLYPLSINALVISTLDGFVPLSISKAFDMQFCHFY